MATGIVTAIIDERYQVTPDYAISDSVEGISILKTPLTVGQQVRIVQVGLENDPRGAEYGFVAVDANIPGVINVTDNIKQTLIAQNPANFGCAYIANMAGLVTRLFNIGEVISSDSRSVQMQMLTGNQSGATVRLDAIGVDAAEFVAGEVALIDERTYGGPAVVGWWEVLQNLFALSVIIFNEGTVSVNGIAYVEPVEIREGEAVSLLAVPAENFYLESWGGDASGSDVETSITMPDRDATVTALFLAVPTIRLLIGYNPAITPFPCLYVGGGRTDYVTATLNGVTYGGAGATITEGIRVPKAPVNFSFNFIDAEGWEFRDWFIPPSTSIEDTSATREFDGVVDLYLRVKPEELAAGAGVVLDGFGTMFVDFTTFGVSHTFNLDGGYSWGTYIIEDDFEGFFDWTGLYKGEGENFFIGVFYDGGWRMFGAYRPGGTSSLLGFIPGTPSAFYRRQCNTSFLVSR